MIGGYLANGQDLSTVLRCCSLGSPLKILPYGFFCYGMKVYYLIK